MTFAFDAETARGLVIRCRRDWDPNLVDGPVARARHPLHWSDGKIALTLLHVLMDEGSTPADFADAVDREQPPQRREGLAPEQNAARAAEVRAAAGIPPQLHEAGEPV